MSELDTQKRHIRQSVRAARKRLSPSAQKHASQKVFAQLKRAYLLRPGYRIALYLGNDGELDPRHFISQLRSLNLEIYLPVLHPLKTGHLLFARYQPSTSQKMIKNRYGIEEPSLKHTAYRTARGLHVILMPLVAFDEQGNRLGMGGGYYDRTLAFKRMQRTLRPRLYGLAHALQKVEKLPTAAWDITLNGIITDRQIYHPATRSCEQNQ